MIELRSGTTTAAVDPERGGRLVSLAVDGRELIVPPPDASDRSIYWGSFLMAPWVGRIEHGVLAWNGRRVDLPRNEEGHAIHGLVHERAWEVEAATCCTATLACRVDPAAWPFGATVRQTFELDTDHLSIAAELCAETAMPASIGWHPWFRRNGGGPVVTLAAAEVLETQRLIPTGRRVPVDGLTDLREGGRVCERELDHVYPDAASPAIARWPDLELAVEFGPPLTTVVVHSRPQAFCIEPQTAWPNAPALAAGGMATTGLATLAAGERLRAVMTLRWTPIEAAPPA